MGESAPRPVLPPLVLVVDDEPMVRSLMKATLVPTYRVLLRVLLATDAREALSAATHQLVSRHHLFISGHLISA